MVLSSLRDISLRSALCTIKNLKRLRPLTNMNLGESSALRAHMSLHCPNLYRAMFKSNFAGLAYDKKDADAWEGYIQTERDMPPPESALYDDEEFCQMLVRKWLFSYIPAAKRTMRLVHYCFKTNRVSAETVNEYPHVACLYPNSMFLMKLQHITPEIIETYFATGRADLAKDLDPTQYICFRQVLNQRPALAAAAPPATLRSLQCLYLRRAVPGPIVEIARQFEIVELYPADYFTDQVCRDLLAKTAFRRLAKRLRMLESMCQAALMQDVENYRYIAKTGHWPLEWIMAILSRASDPGEAWRFMYPKHLPRSSMSQQEKEELCWLLIRDAPNASPGHLEDEDFDALTLEQKRYFLMYASLKVANVALEWLKMFGGIGDVLTQEICDHLILTVKPSNGVEQLVQNNIFILLPNQFKTERLCTHYIKHELNCWPRVPKTSENLKLWFETHKPAANCDAYLEEFPMDCAETRKIIAHFPKVVARLSNLDLSVATEFCLENRECLEYIREPALSNVLTKCAKNESGEWRENWQENLRFLKENCHKPFQMLLFYSFLH